MTTSGKIGLLLHQHQEHRLHTLGDGELLRRFSEEKDQSAFTALLQRHGRMVYGICRRLLHCPQDMDDVFQATFLVLVQKTEKLCHRPIVGDWLHGVAYHTALKARAMKAHRRRKEEKVARSEAVMVEMNSEWLSVLDEEIRKLPARYRRMVVLCDLQQRTRQETARLMGIPAGTVASGLSRARAILARRLKMRGYEVPAAILSTVMAQQTLAHVIPQETLSQTSSSAVQIASGITAGVTTKVALLMQYAVKSSLSKLAVLALLAGVLVTGAGSDIWITPSVDIHKKPVFIGSIERPAKSTAQTTVSAKIRRADSPVRMSVPVNPGTEEEIVSQLNLTSEQLEAFQRAQGMMKAACAEMYQMETGFIERGQLLNSCWNQELRCIFTDEQYQRYCAYWATHEPTYYAMKR